MTKGIMGCTLLGFLGTVGAMAANRFVNPAFELGRESWVSLATPDKPYWHDFTIAPDPTNPTNKCARLNLDSRAAHEKTEVWGMLQEVSEAGEIPRFLRGRYFVEEWQRGTEKQYVQVVFNVWLTDNLFGKRGDHAGTMIPLQVAFVLGGITEPPFNIANRKFIFQGLREPRVGEWVEFEFDLHAAFANDLKFTPEKFRGFRVLFEARFDGRTDGGKDARATVLFDDLYLGNESAGPIPSSRGLVGEEARPPVR